MEQVNFKGSMKNVPQCSEREYIMKLTHATEVFIWRLRWFAAFFLGIIEVPDNDFETYGFRTNKPPPIIPEMKPFEDKLVDNISTIKFRKSTNEHQKKMKEDIKKIKKEDKLFIAGDKTKNYYKCDVEEYSKLKTREITKGYKKCTEDDVNKVTREDKRIAENLMLEQRIPKTIRRESFQTFKDHKENFQNNKQSRLINPCKPEIGQVSKRIVENVVNVVKNLTGYQQWKNTLSVLQWFKGIVNKQSFTFIQFDIIEFYPSIDERLLKDSIQWAETYVPVSDDQKQIIFHVRQNFLYHKNQPWVKKGNSNFDVPMGAYDSAEVCELVGLYLLHQLNNADLGVQFGLYRDDGLALSNLCPFDTEKVKQEITRIFEENRLKIKIEANQKIVNYLDVTLSLDDGSYKPYTKPNTKPVYVHSKSNHPPAVLKNIPKMVNQRLNMLSSSEEIFNSAVQQYQEALEDSEYEHKLEYEEVNIFDMNEGNKTRRRRYKNEFWYNPPWNMNVQSKIGEQFLKALDSEIKPDNPLRKVFNRHTIKISYSNMPNMARVISTHNSKIYNKKMEEEKEQEQNKKLQTIQQKIQQNQQLPQTRARRKVQQQLQQQQQQMKNEKRSCNCRGGPRNCPLGGRCLSEKSVVYYCKVTRLDNNTSEYYTGLTEGPFKFRLYGHNSSFKNNKGKNNTMLSKHIWWLKSNNIRYHLEWKILGKARGYNPVTKVCRLCLLEKYFIMYKPETATLNSRDEFFNPCRHKWKHFLSNS